MQISDETTRLVIITNMECRLLVSATKWVVFILILVFPVQPLKHPLATPKWTHHESQQGKSYQTDPVKRCSPGVHFWASQRVFRQGLLSSLRYIFFDVHLINSPDKGIPVYIRFSKYRAMLSYPSFINQPETTPRTNWVSKMKFNSQPATSKIKA